MTKRWMGYLLAGTLIANGTMIHAVERIQEDKAIFKIGSTDVQLFGKQTQLEVPPEVVEGRTLLPLRFIGEQLLEAYVGYNAKTKQITVRQNDTVIELKVGSTVATVNGEEVQLDAIPMIKEGTTLLPLRFMVEAFDLKINYDAVTKNIEVQKPIQIINQAPTVHFKFDEENYTQGEVLEATIEVADQEGDEIVAYRWMLDYDEHQTYETLEALSKEVTPNLSPISLKVKDEKGAWSEWYTEYIVIKPNSQPVIEHFETAESSYDRGEEIAFEFDYTNESFEVVVDEKWSYRKKGESLSQSILEKPEAIYEEGEYIVTLQLQDEVGQWSSKKETTVTINSKGRTTEMEHLFTEGKGGDILANFEKTNFRNYPDVDFIESDQEGVLIMSNSPERVQDEGILYHEYVNGEGRMMFHHINATNKNQKLMIVAENKSEEVVTGEIINQVVKGPSSDVLFAGQQLLFDHLDADHTTQVTLEKDAIEVIYDSSERKWMPEQVISGMFEFDFSGDVKLTVVAMNPDGSVNLIEKLPYLERDVHPRGTFDVVNREIFVDLDGMDGPSKIVIGDGEREWISGHDGITGEAVVNKGNFGVEYYVTVRPEEDTAVILNPRGNMYKGAIKWSGEAPFMTPNVGYFPDEKRATFLGVLKGGISRTFTYMLPNGSSAPVLIGFIPESDWDE